MLQQQQQQHQHQQQQLMAQGQLGQPATTPGGSQIRPPVQGANPFTGNANVSNNLHIPLGKQRNLSGSGPSGGPTGSPAARPPLPLNVGGIPLANLPPAAAAAAVQAQAAQQQVLLQQQMAIRMIQQGVPTLQQAGGRPGLSGRNASEITPAMMMNQQGGGNGAAGAMGMPGAPGPGAQQQQGAGALSLIHI